MVGIILKKHIIQNQLFIVVYDEELKDKVLEEGNIYIDLRMKYYQGEVTSIDVIKESLESAKNIIAIGNNTIDILNKENIEFEPRSIGGVPFIHLMR